jgi:diguanylate cyclase (GGDEF)-like protein
LPAAKTSRLIAVLVIASALAWRFLIRSVARPGVGLHLSWWELALGFAAADILVFHIEINREAHTFSLSEVPFVLGLFFASPDQLIIGRLVGEACVLIFNERQNLVKLAFNLSLFLGECCAALAVFTHLIRGHGLDQPYAWAVGFFSVGSAGALSAFAVATVIRWHGGNTGWRRLAATASITALCNSCVAVIAGLLAVDDPPAVALLAVIAAGLLAAYRGYTSLSQRYSGLEMLYDFARVTSTALRPQATLERIAAESRRLLRADTAWILLSPGDDGGAWLGITLTGDGELVERKDDSPLPLALQENVVAYRETVLAARTTKNPRLRALLEELGMRDCVVAPLVASDRVTGALLVANRLGDVSTFDHNDARVLATLAAQAGVALENGRLIERLRDEAARREHEALHDPLTALGNRTYFRSELDAAILDAQDGGSLAVLIMDLDRFKEINDALGHHAGDQLLQSVAQRIAAVVDGRGTVARLGGDEFAILLPGIDRVDQAVDVARHIQSRVSLPATVASIVVEVNASIGVAMYPDHAHDSTTLMRRADVAMYEAKTSRNDVAIYDPEQDWNTPDRLRLVTEFRNSLENGELVAYFQPIARLHDSAIVGVEALARWHHPEHGTLFPDEFIPIAERSGLLDELTSCILMQGLGQLREWQEAGLELTLAVNLPVQSLLDVELPARVQDLLRRYEVSPTSLTLEITESGIMSSPERMLGVLCELADGGIQLAVDDFGTGYSSLSYLQRLPVSQLKIDKSFTFALTTDPKAASIVRSVTELGRNLGLTVVAEGVEDRAALRALKVMGCDHAQGYYYSKAIPGTEITAWMVARSPLVIAS